MKRSVIPIVVLAVIAVALLQVALASLERIAAHRKTPDPTVQTIVESTLEARLLGRVGVEDLDEGPGRDLVVRLRLAGSFAPRAVANEVLDALHGSLEGFGEQVRGFRLVLNEGRPNAATLEAELPWEPARRFVGDPPAPVLPQKSPPR